MKKVCLIIGIFITCLICSNVNAENIDKIDTYTLKQNEETIINFKEEDTQKIGEFIAPSNGWYEFSVEKPKNSTYLTLYNSNSVELSYNISEEQFSEVVVYGSLEKGKKYKLLIKDYGNENREVRVLVKKHIHNFKLVYAFEDEASYSCDCQLSKEGHITASLNKKKYTYDGKAKKPEVTIKNTASIKINDYKVIYQKGRKNIGTYEVKIEFTNEYAGLDPIIRTFEIVPKNTNKLTLKSKKGSIKAKWNKQTKKTSGYQLRYSSKKNMKHSKIITIKNNKDTKHKIKNLKNKKKYYVQVRTYKVVKEKAFCSSWSKVNSIKTK